MPEPKRLTYRDAGLDLEKYAESMAGIAPMLARTWDTTRVIPPPFPARTGGKGSGGFASLFDPNPDGRYTHPVLVTCTDGVGTKLKIAAMMRKFDTVGIDLVAMSVNDLICTGGEPLTFLDYLAMPTDDPALTKQLVTGISEGCLLAGCSLVGGETAILPDFYAPGDFDMAGFCTGVVERDHILDGRAILPGDAILGIASSGIHSNGYSLVRKIVFDSAKLNVNDTVPEIGGSVGEVLLTPTRIYVKPVRKLLDTIERGRIHGLANITGGGLPDNIGRILPPGMRAVIERGSWEMPAVFRWMQRLGGVEQAEMEKVFNVGVGFVVIGDPTALDDARQQLRDGGLSAWKIGTVTAGEVGVEIR